MPSGTAVEQRAKRPPYIWIGLAALVLLSAAYYLSTRFNQFPADRALAAQVNDLIVSTADVADDAQSAADAWGESMSPAEIETASKQLSSALGELAERGEDILPLLESLSNEAGSDDYRRYVGSVKDGFTAWQGAIDKARRLSADLSAVAASADALNRSSRAYDQALSVAKQGNTQQATVLLQGAATRLGEAQEAVAGRALRGWRGLPGLLEGHAELVAQAQAGLGRGGAAGLESVVTGATWVELRFEQARAVAQWGGQLGALGSLLNQASQDLEQANTLYGQAQKTFEEQFEDR